MNEALLWQKQIRTNLRSSQYIKRLVFLSTVLSKCTIAATLMFIVVMCQAREAANCLWFISLGFAEKFESITII